MWPRVNHRGPVATSQKRVLCVFIRGIQNAAWTSTSAGHVARMASLSLSGVQRRLLEAFWTAQLGLSICGLYARHAMPLSTVFQTGCRPGLRYLVLMTVFTKSFMLQTPPMARKGVAKNSLSRSLEYATVFGVSNSSDETPTPSPSPPASVPRATVVGGYTVIMQISTDGCLGLIRWSCGGSERARASGADPTPPTSSSSRLVEFDRCTGPGPQTFVGTSALYCTSMESQERQ